MRILAVSDLHVDYESNARWIANLSNSDYVDDVLILAGDVSDSMDRLQRTLDELAKRFRNLLFVPGNHELWVVRDRPRCDSLEKFERVRALVERSGASMSRLVANRVEIVPLLGWYDYSFGLPGDVINEAWTDFHACAWPDGFTPMKICAHFTSLNCLATPSQETVISFSHFLPRVDVMPPHIPHSKRILYPVLGATVLDEQIRSIGSTMHVYGHSHVNRRIRIDGVTYVNNAFGYPHEERITSKDLLCIHSC